MLHKTGKNWCIGIGHHAKGTHVPLIWLVAGKVVEVWGQGWQVGAIRLSGAYLCGSTGCLQTTYLFVIELYVGIKLKRLSEVTECDDVFRFGDCNICSLVCSTRQF